SSAYNPQMAADTSGRLWVIDGADLIQVDMNNPAASTVCFTVTEFVGKQVTDMTGASTTAGATGSLYAMGEESTGYELWRIDIGPGSCPSTYTATPPISNTGVTDIWGIAYDPDGKFSGGKPVVYAVALHGGMYEIDTVSGTAYSIGCAGDCG